MYCVYIVFVSHSISPLTSHFSCLKVHEHMMECTFFREEYDESGHVINKGEPDLELEAPRQ